MNKKNKKFLDSSCNADTEKVNMNISEENLKEVKKLNMNFIESKWNKASRTVEKV